MNTGKLIALEGIDGAGKSTLCRSLALRVGGVAYATPPKKYLVMRERVDARATPDDHFRFYLDALRDADAEIRAMLAEGKIVVCDRHWASTYVYHVVMGVEVKVSDFVDIKLPDWTVLLSVNEEIQIHRLLARGMSAGDRRMLDSQRRLLTTFVDTLKNTNNYLHIDTSYLSPEKVLESVIQIVS